MECWIVRLACLDENSIDFSKKIEGHALQNSTIASYDKMDFDECKTMCYDELKCKSINYSDQMKRCEINSKIQETSSSGDLIAKSGFTYYSTDYQTKNVSFPFFTCTKH